MEIKSVKLVHYPEIKEGTLEDGLPVASRPESFVFDVEAVGADGIISVPNNPTNAHYWLVKEWYDNQDKKPFDFQFEELAEPEFEETIYPDQPEEESEPQE